MKKSILLLLILVFGIVPTSNSIDLAGSESFQQYFADISKNEAVNLELKKQKVLKYFHQALIDFGLPVEKTEILFVNLADKSISAYVNSLKHRIYINLSSNYFQPNSELNDYNMIWVAYHEVGHIIDKAALKSRVFIGIPMVLSTCVLALSSAKYIHYDKYFLSKNNPIFDCTAYLLSSLSILKINEKILKSRLYFNFVKNQEHTANLIACEKLVAKGDKDSLYAIVAYLFERKRQLLRYPNIKPGFETMGGHDYEEEFQKVSEFLNSKGYEVSEEHDYAKNILKVCIFKDNKIFTGLSL